MEGHASVEDLIEEADGFAEVFPEHKFMIVKTLQVGWGGCMLCAWSGWLMRVGFGGWLVEVVARMVGGEMGPTGVPPLGAPHVALLHSVFPSPPAGAQAHVRHDR